MRLLIAVAAVVAVTPAAAGTRLHLPPQPDVAALQVGLSRSGLYPGPVDGLDGPATTAALRVFQQRSGLVASGVLDRPTRAAFEAWGSQRLGKRSLSPGASGWDVAELQFLLARHGFPSGRFSGRFDAHVDRALRRFERRARLPVDGTAGPAVVRALREPVPVPRVTFVLPVASPQIGDGFGPRGLGFHTGIDMAAAAGTPVTAAAAGRVVWAAWLDGGWGLTVTVDHGNGLRTMYAHLSRIEAALGSRVDAGARLGAVGATGDATGAHLHFELKLRGASVDPAPALGLSAPPSAVTRP
jgi:murein DD-endopeptidase MepM/ murein hydrolase activator NlpD